MEPFRLLTAQAAPLARDNVDTEVIIPIDRLVALQRGQLGPYCFEPWRYERSARLRDDFELNDPRYRDARILVTGANFGCGSSREAAVWALWDFGFRCIIAESFGDIFLMNCFQNGLVPISLEKAAVRALITEICGAVPASLTVDLEQQHIRSPGGLELAFRLPPDRRVALLEGLDEVGLTLRQLPEIRAFQQHDALERPWAYVSDPEPHA